MSDPLTGTGLIFGGGLIGSVVYGVITHTDFGVVFGAFGGAVFLCGNDRKPDTWKANSLLHDVVYCRCSGCRIIRLKIYYLDRLYRSSA